MVDNKRKIVITSFLSLDGVMQAPGGPDEDTSGEFEQGGWSVNFWDETMMQVMGEIGGKPFDLLLGRKTYEIFASHWPYAEEDNAKVFNNAKKWVVSSSLDSVAWNNSELISENVAEEIAQLKKTEGPEIQVHGSSNLIQTLLKHQLVDEFWLWMFPVALGKGKRFFEQYIDPLSFTLDDVRKSTTGVIIAKYSNVEKFETSGTFELEDASQEYQEAQENRRKKMEEDS